MEKGQGGCGSLLTPAGQRVAMSGKLSLPPLQWSGPKPRMAGPVWPGASVADLSTKLEPFFARPPTEIQQRRKAPWPAAGAEKNQAPRQTADFMNKMLHFARLPARCAGKQLSTWTAWHHRHRDHGTFNLRRSNAPSGQCCAALRARRGAQTVTARRVPGGARKALLQDRGNGAKHRHEMK